MKNSLFPKRAPIRTFFFLSIILSNVAQALDDCQRKNTCTCSSTGEASGSCYVLVPTSTSSSICSETACICTAVPKPLGGVTYMKSCESQSTQ